MLEALGYSLENNIRENRMLLFKRLVAAAALGPFRTYLSQAFSGGLAAVALTEETAVA